MLFPIAIGVLLAAVIAALLYPLWGRNAFPLIVGEEAAADEERVNLQIEKQTLLNSLLELSTDYAQGKIFEPDFKRLKLDYERRLAELLDRLDLLSRPKRGRRAAQISGVRSSVLIPIVLGIVVSVGASLLYSFVNARTGLEAQRVAYEQRGSDFQMPNPIEMVARLEKRLKENPDDLQDQIMAGRSYMALKRYDDALAAWNKVLALDFKSHEAHYNLGVIGLIMANPGDRKVYQKALEHLDTALIAVPRDPAVLWHQGVALVHLERYPEADEAWTEAFSGLSPGTEDSDFVKKALQELRAGTPPLF